MLILFLNYDYVNAVWEAPDGTTMADVQKEWLAYRKANKVRHSQKRFDAWLRDVKGWKEITNWECY